MHEIIKQISRIGILPVLKLDREEDALPVGEALLRGGIDCVEVTFRTAAARGAVEKMAKAFPDMLVGAGTVLTTGQVDEAVAAGAKFIVTPGLNPMIVRYCQAKDIPIIPGINDPTGIEQAMVMGLDVVKFFPAQASGGIEMIKAMGAPYIHIAFLPTGGINYDNMNDYLTNQKVVAVGGSWVVNEAMIRMGDFNGIMRVAREAVDRMLNFRLEHVGINCANEQEAADCAETCRKTFAFEPRELPVSFFAGAGLEFMKNGGRGTNGHIAICTNNVDRAVYHLERRGVAFDMSTAQYNPDGSLRFIYLRDEIGGFAYHLVMR
ncbi:MAG: bifunctional 4-hydroxy-2-oxoglutarate aldolase/2-dehydro-3-deoxy-phosphogluconate aldolase [Clostridia bacterium]|nr:bifunctional 4-hydroxy-2-oxoglutarate aldolase/2-dehydro-3-deoxy-phosphogluconate aldolase [Clostridia bacterium]